MVALMRVGRRMRVVWEVEVVIGIEGRKVGSRGTVPFWGRGKRLVRRPCCRPS